MLSTRYHPERRSGAAMDLRASVPADGSRLQPSKASLGLRHRWLITLTTSRFRPTRDIAPRFQSPFARYENAGWSLRAASPRNFVCWRDSCLVKEGDLPLAVLPSRQFGLPGEEMAALCLFELLRRETRLGLLARGLPPRLADEPAAILWLQGTVWCRLFEHQQGPEMRSGFFADLESGIGEAVLGRTASTRRRCRHGGLT